MTIKECVRINGLQSEVSGSLKRYQTVDVGFVNSDGKDDETQFDVRNVFRKEGIEELSQLFSCFCKENGFQSNTVSSITIVRCGDSLEELET